MTPDLQTLLSIVAVGVAMLGIVAGVVRWVVSSAVTSIREAFDNHMAAEQSALDSIASRLNHHEARIDAIERQVAASPSKDDLHSLALALERANGRLEAGVERFRAIETAIGKFDDAVRDLNHCLREQRERAME